MSRCRMLALSFIMGMASVSSVAADVITDWNEKAVAFVTPRMAPPAAQRAMAIVHVAMFDAVNSIERRYRPYRTQLPARAGTSMEAAAATAAGVVLQRLIPQVEKEVTAALAAYVAAIADGDAKPRWRVRSWRLAPMMALLPPTPIGPRPSQASTFQRQSPSALHGRTSSHSP